ncbi:MAG: tetratricopeptide repeat protein [Pirellulales bacterium]
MASVESAFQTAHGHQRAGRWAEGETLCRRILEQHPSHAGSWHLLGVIAFQMGRRGDALAAIRQAIAIDPRQAAFHCHLGEVHRALGQLDEARLCYERAIQLQPDFADPYNNMGLLLRITGDVPGAVRQFQRAIELQPNDADTHHGLGCALLLQGDFERGWREYAWRFRSPGRPSTKIPLPEWDGTPLLGQRLLTYAEQGFGDTLNFIRYLPLVESRGSLVTAVVQEELLPILTASGFKNLIPPRTPAPTCVAHLPLVGLPGALGTTLKTVPASVPYLHADPQLVERWRARLSPIAGFRVGIAWQGQKSHPLDVFRSIPLAAFEPLARPSGVRLVSLQIGEGARQIDGLAGRFAVTCFDDPFDVEHGPFMDTAAVMMNLDLVVTCDSAIAHLAGALGVPVWVALCAAPDWRWMLNRPDSPWYPTMRLFRQSVLGQWSDVFAAIANAITESRQR